MATVRRRINSLAVNLGIPLFALAIVLGFLAAQQQGQANASSYGHGDCWRAFGRSCPYNYAFSLYTWNVGRYWAPGGSSSYLDPAALSAMSVWTGSSGPQIFQSSPGTPGTTLFMYEYPYYADPGGLLATTGAAAVTYNRDYPSNNICVSLGSPCYEWYGTIYVNNTSAQYSGFSSIMRQGLLAHELGHVMLLGHSSASFALMHSPYTVGVSSNAPTSVDIGTNPACNEDPGGANPDAVTVFCIYDW